jgi:hypothetical protein
VFTLSKRAFKRLFCFYIQGVYFSNMNEKPPTNGNEEIDDSFVTLAGGELSEKAPSVMQVVEEAKASGDPAQIAQAEQAADEKYMVSPPEASPNSNMEGGSDMESASKVISQIDAVVAEWADRQPKNTDTNGLNEITNLAKETYELVQNWKDTSTEGVAKKEELVVKMKEIRAVRDKIYNHEMKYAGI